MRFGGRGVGGRGWGSGGGEGLLGRKGRGVVGEEGRGLSGGGEEVVGKGRGEGDWGKNYTCMHQTKCKLSFRIHPHAQIQEEEIWGFGGGGGREGRREGGGGREGRGKGEERGREGRGREGGKGEGWGEEEGWGQELQAPNKVYYVRKLKHLTPLSSRTDPCRAFIQLPCGGMGVDQDTYWNETHTSNAARMVRAYHVPYLGSSSTVLCMIKSS